jgi:hypothetical protein
VPLEDREDRGRRPGAPARRPRPDHLSGGRNPGAAGENRNLHDDGSADPARMSSPNVISNGILVSCAAGGRTLAVSGSSGVPLRVARRLAGVYWIDDIDRLLPKVTTRCAEKLMRSHGTPCVRYIRCCTYSANPLDLGTCTIAEPRKRLGAPRDDRIFTTCSQVDRIHARVRSTPSCQEKGRSGTSSRRRLVSYRISVMRLLRRNVVKGNLSLLTWSPTTAAARKAATGASRMGTLRRAER